MADLLIFCRIGQVAQNTPPGEEKIANCSRNPSLSQVMGLAAYKLPPVIGRVHGLTLVPKYGHTGY